MKRSRWLTCGRNPFAWHHSMAARAASAASGRWNSTRPSRRPSAGTARLAPPREPLADEATLVADDRGPKAERLDVRPDAGGHPAGRDDHRHTEGDRGRDR